MTLRIKIVLGILLVSVLVSVVLLYLVYRWIDSSENALLESHANVLSRQMETILTPAIRDQNTELLSHLIRDLTSDPAVEFVRLSTAKGETLAQFGQLDHPGHAPGDVVSTGLTSNGVLYTGAVIKVDGQLAGYIELGVKAASRQQLMEEFKLLGLRAGLPAIGLLFLISYLIGHVLTRPLNELTRVADEIAANGPGETIVVHGNDEVTHVMSLFNKMSRSLDVSYHELHESVERYKQLSSNISQRDTVKSAMLSTALDAIITIDGDGLVTEYNPAAERIFGYSFEEVIGQEMAELIIPVKYREAHRQGIRKWHETGEGPVLGTRLEIEAQNRDGKVFPIELAITPLNLQDKTYFSGFIREITERKEAEEALRIARKEAEDANVAKSRFLANMSHEIRTPLNAIINLNSLLLETSLDDEQRTLASAANKGGVALSTLVDGVLDFSKIEAGKMKLQVQAFNLHDMVSSLEALFLPMADNRGLKFHSIIDANVPEWVEADENLLRQVFLNLVGNAIKFTKSGSVTVSLESANDGALLFRIADTGIGVAPEYVAHLFEEFTRADSSLTREHGGTGLGLTITRSLVELMGGEIEYAPREGGGSTFAFSIPIVEVTATSEEADSGEVSQFPMTARVLVAEDSQGSRMVTEVLLQKAGCEVRLVTDGAEAVQAVSEERFDAILMDMSMPNMDGLEATRQIRAMEGAASRVPIIAMTANVFTEDRQLCMEAGMNDFIGKPIDIKTLLGRLAHWVSIVDQLPGTDEEGVPEMRQEDDNISGLMDQHMLDSLEKETSRELITDIIGIFIKETGEHLAALREAGKNQDQASVVSEAHAIKSSAGTFGAIRLQEMAGRVEMLGRQGETTQAIAMIDSVEDITLRTLELYTTLYLGAEDVTPNTTG